MSTWSMPRSMSWRATARVNRPRRSAPACSPTIQPLLDHEATSDRPVAMRLAISCADSVGSELKSRDTFGIVPETTTVTWTSCAGSLMTVVARTLTSGSVVPLYVRYPSSTATAL